MKFNPKMKKLLLISSLVLVAVVLTGCSIPTDPETKEIATNNILTNLRINGNIVVFLSIILYIFFYLILNFAPA